MLVVVVGVVFDDFGGYRIQPDLWNGACYIYANIFKLQQQILFMAFIIKILSC